MNKKLMWHLNATYVHIQWREILKLWSSLAHAVSIQFCRLMNIKMAVKDCPSIHRKNIFLVPVLNTVVSSWLAVVCSMYSFPCNLFTVSHLRMNCKSESVVQQTGYFTVTKYTTKWITNIQTSMLPPIAFTTLKKLKTFISTL